MPIEFVVTAPKKIEFREYAESPLQPDEVRVRSIVSGIKLGTEMALYSGETPFLDQQFDPDLRLFQPAVGQGLYPCTLGSWLAGEVVEIGSAVRQFQVGDRVHGGLPHRPTNACKAGDLYPLKAGIEPETALFTDPAIFALQAVHDAQVKVGDEVAVFGMGALGLLAIQIARMNGARHVYAVDVLPARLALACELGADRSLDAASCDPGFELKQLTGGKGVDVAIEISGAYSALQSAIRAVHPGGLLVTASYFKGNGRELSLGAEWHHNRLTLVSSMPVWGMPHRCSPMWDLKRIERTAIDLLESGRLVVAPLVGQRFPYFQAVEAYHFIDEHPGDAVKVLLDYA
jgi:threonine dehydrogenase-like Zn-dependent dehydrogenase